jgi:hypothetical protein
VGQKQWALLDLPNKNIPKFIYERNEVNYLREIYVADFQH